MRSSTSKRRGMTTLIAVALIGIASAAAAVLTASVGNDYRRTHRAAQEAQARQLLLAAHSSLQERMAAWNGSPEPASWELELPPQLLPTTGAKKTVAIKIVDRPKPNARVEVVLDRYHLTENIGLSRVEGKWKMTGMSITP